MQVSAVQEGAKASQYGISQLVKLLCHFSDKVYPCEVCGAVFPHQQPSAPVQQQGTWEPPDQRGATQAGEACWWQPALGAAQRGWGWGSALLGWETCGQHSWGVTTATTTRGALQRDRCS